MSPDMLVEWIYIHFIIRFISDYDERSEVYSALCPALCWERKTPQYVSLRKPRFSRGAKNAYHLFIIFYNW